MRLCVEASSNVDREQPTCTSTPRETHYKCLVSGSTGISSKPQHLSCSSWDLSQYKFLWRKKNQISWKFSTSPHKQSMSAENNDLHSSTLPLYPMTVTVQFMPPSSKGNLSPVSKSLRSQPTVIASWQPGLHRELGSQEYTSFTCWFPWDPITSSFNLLLRNISFSIRDEFYHWKGEQLYMRN